MRQKKPVRFAAAAVFIFTVILFQACSKSSGSDDNQNPPADYYFTASISGKTFSANFVSPTLGGPGIAGTTTSGGVQFIIAFGIQIVNSNDSSILLLVFPAKTALNTPTNLSPGINTGAVYSMESSPGSSTYYAYGTNPDYGGSGTFTVTEFDQTKKIVAGTFSGTFGAVTGAKVTVTKGKFRCVLTGSTSSFPPNVKF